MKDFDIEIVDDNNKTNVSSVKSDSKADSLSMPKEEQLILTDDEKAKLSKVEDKRIEIKDNSVLSGEKGSQVIGNLNGDTITANNKPLPDAIDITIKQKKAPKEQQQKKIKVVTKKDKIISIIATVFVIIGILIGGFSLYYFGYKNNPNIYSVKNVSFELGDDLPSSAKYYVSSPLPVDDMDFDVDLSLVAENIGTYDYSVSHKNVVKSGKITIVDTVAPTLVYKEDLVFRTNTTISKSDIVASCDDLSGCDYRLESKIDTEFPGEKDANIIATDNQNNEKKDTVKVKVVDIQKTVVCTGKEAEEPGHKFTSKDVYTLYFDGNDSLVMSSGMSSFQYLAAGYDDYFNLYYEKLTDESDEYEFNNQALSYTRKVKVNTNNLTGLSELTKYYTESGFKCKEQVNE